MISLDQISVHFGSTSVLDNLTFDIEKGDRFIILGANGSGKSTILKVIAGLVNPSSGSITINEDSYYQDNVNNRKKLGILIEKGSMFKHLTVFENLKYRALLLNTSVKNVADFLKDSKLEEHLNKKVNELSMGNVQKLGLALALLDQPEILLLDEPTSALDPESKVQFDELLCQINENHGTTIVLVTHDKEEANRVGNRIINIEKGSAVELKTDAIKQRSKNENLLEKAQELIANNQNFRIENGKIIKD